MLHFVILSLPKGSMETKVEPRLKYAKSGDVQLPWYFIREVPFGCSLDANHRGKTWGWDPNWGQVKFSNRNGGFIAAKFRFNRHTESLKRLHCFSSYDSYHSCTVENNSGRVGRVHITLKSAILKGDALLHLAKGPQLQHFIGSNHWSIIAGQFKKAHKTKLWCSFGRIIERRHPKTPFFQKQITRSLAGFLTAPFLSVWALAMISHGGGPGECVHVQT